LTRMAPSRACSASMLWGTWRNGSLPSSLAVWLWAAATAKAALRGARDEAVFVMPAFVIDSAARKSHLVALHRVTPRYQQRGQKPLAMWRISRGGCRADPYCVRGAHHQADVRDAGTVVERRQGGEGRRCQGGDGQAVRTATYASAQRAVDASASVRQSAACRRQRNGPEPVHLWASGHHVDTHIRDGRLRGHDKL